jgi:glycosyltransferase involved in cell wall biosynthesis
MTISVIIPAWNAERHIARAIDSVLAQTRPAEEIIVVDDGSTDGTAEAVRAFGTRVQLICQPNGGASVARNTGIAAATGQWIAFLDADDEWLPEKLRLQAERHQQYPALQWSFTRLEWARPEWPTHRLAHPDAAPKTGVFEDYLAAYCAGFFMSTITVMVHRSVFEAVGGFEPGMKRAQDNDLWFRIAYQFPQVGYIPRSLAVYHLDTPNSSTKINDSVEFMTALIERHRDLSQQFNRAEAFRPCITHTLQVWIRQLQAQKRKQEAMLLLNRFASFLSGRFRREMYFRLFVPGLGPAIADVCDGIKKRCRGKRTS